MNIFHVLIFHPFCVFLFEKWKWSHSVMSNSLRPQGLQPIRLPSPWDFSGVGCRFLLQRIFLTQGSNPGLLHCRQSLYLLSHQGRICFKNFPFLWIAVSLLSCKSFFDKIILETRPLWDKCLENNFSKSPAYHFIFLRLSLWKQRFSFCLSNLINCYFFPCFLLLIL